MLQITESKFYKQSELHSEIHIADGVSAVIFDQENLLTTVTFGKKASLQYFGYFSTEQDFDKNFCIDGTENNCEVYVLLSSRGEKIRARVNGKLQSSQSKLNMHIVSFVSDGGYIDLDGIVHITDGVEKVEGYLVEENIFLGSTGKVRGLPTLLVHSNDVKASHACNMERISDEKLFYLRSRGLPREDAVTLMLEGYISKVFGKLEAENEDMYKGLKEQILARVKQK